MAQSPAASATLNLLEMQVLRLSPNLMTQNPGRRKICVLASFPGNSNGPVSELAHKEFFSLIIDEGAKEQRGSAACPSVHRKWLEC